MNQNLLDDNNIESEYKGSLLKEIKRVEIWLSILAVLGFIIGVSLLFIAFSYFAIDNGSTVTFILLGMGFVQGGLLVYWSFVAFQYTKSAKYYDPERISKRLEHLLEDNSRLWRATALLFLGFLSMLGVAALA